MSRSCSPPADGAGPFTHEKRRPGAHRTAVISCTFSRETGLVARAAIAVAETAAATAAGATRAARTAAKAAAAAGTTTAARSAIARFVNGQRAPIDRLAIEVGDCLVGSLRRREFDKSEIRATGW